MISSQSNSEKYKYKNSTNYNSFKNIKNINNIKK